MKMLWLRHLSGSIRSLLNDYWVHKNVINNTGWLFIDNFLRIGVGFFVNAWLIRYLGPERLGILNYSIAFVALFIPLAQLGLDAIVVRNIVSDPTRRDEILGSAFALKVVGSLITILFALAAIFSLRPDDRLTQLLVSISILGTLLQPFGVIDFWFQSQVTSKYSVIARTTANFAGYAAKMIIILFGGSLLALAWVGVAEMILFSIGLVLVYHVKAGRLNVWTPTKKMALILLKDSWLLMISDLIYLLYLRIDRILIGEIHSATELGIYSVAVVVAEVFFFATQSVSLSLFPGVIKAKFVSPELFHEKMQKYYRLMAFMGYIVAIPISLLARWLVPLIFGPAYINAVPMLLILVWGCVFLNLINARSYYLTAMNWTRLHLVMDVTGCLANIALNLYLIPRYGGVGAAAASIITYFLTAYVLCFVFKSLRETGIMMTKAMIYPKFW